MNWWPKKKIAAASLYVALCVQVFATILGTFAWWASDDGEKWWNVFKFSTEGVWAAVGVWSVIAVLYLIGYLIFGES